MDVYIDFSKAFSHNIFIDKPDEARAKWVGTEVD